MWIYKGDILPYKRQAEEKIAAEAAMATGDAAGDGRPKPVVSSSAARRKVAAEAAPAAAPDEVDPAEAEPLVKEADPEFEKLLAEEEEIERSTREHNETPHFRPGDGD